MWLFKVLLGRRILLALIYKMQTLSNLSWLTCNILLLGFYRLNKIMKTTSGWWFPAQLLLVPGTTGPVTLFFYLTTITSVRWGWVRQINAGTGQHAQLWFKVLWDSRHFFYCSVTCWLWNGAHFLNQCLAMAISFDSTVLAFRCHITIYFISLNM